jgi:hypothetical protein
MSSYHDALISSTIYQLPGAGAPRSVLIRDTFLLNRGTRTLQLRHLIDTKLSTAAVNSRVPEASALEELKLVFTAFAGLIWFIFDRARGCSVTLGAFFKSLGR